MQFPNSLKEIKKKWSVQGLIQGLEVEGAQYASEDHHILININPVITAGKLNYQVSASGIIINNINDKQQAIEIVSDIIDLIQNDKILSTIN